MPLLIKGGLGGLQSRQQFVGGQVSHEGLASQLDGLVPLLVCHGLGSKSRQPIARPEICKNTWATALVCFTHSIKGSRTAWFPSREITHGSVFSSASISAITASAPILEPYWRTSINSASSRHIWNQNSRKFYDQGNQSRVVSGCTVRPQNAGFSTLENSNLWDWGK